MIKNCNFRMSRLVVSLGLMGIVMLVGCKKKGPDALLCHVGGTMRPVMLELAKMYEEKTGRTVEINAAGSGELLGQIESHGEGDFYVCHDPFLDVLMKRNLGVDGWTVAELTPVIAVRKGNAKNIRSLKDLTRPDSQVELFLTDYKKSSLGRMLPTIFAKAGIDFDQLNKDKKIGTHRKGGQAATIVETGNADATIVWNAVAFLRRDRLDVVTIPPEHLPIPASHPDADTVTSATGKAYTLTPMRVTIATLKCSMQPEVAREFAEFVASAEAGEVFRQFGFTMNRSIIRKEYENGQPAGGER